MWWNYAVFMACGSIFEHPEVYALIPKQGNSKHIMIHPWSIQPFRQIRCNLHKCWKSWNSSALQWKRSLCCPLLSVVHFNTSICSLSELLRRCDMFGRTARVNKKWIHSPLQQWLKKQRKKCPLRFIRWIMNTSVDRRRTSGDRPTCSFTLNHSSFHTDLAVTSLREREREKWRTEMLLGVFGLSSPYADAHLWLIWRETLFLSVVLGRLTGYYCIGLCEKK